jgi:hypothetical protein
MNSLWVDIPNFPNYKISPEGNVLSLNYSGGKSSRILKFGTSRDYLNVTLYKDKKPITVKPHRLVAALFCNNPDNKAEVNHIDGNKLNNNYKNLEWVSSSENQRHAYDILKVESARGSKHGMSKLTEFQVLEIYALIKSKTPYSEIVTMFDISKATITNIKTGLTWGHITRR